MQQEPQIYIINKQREQQRDQSILFEWRGVRSQFFTHTIKQTLKEAGATENEQQQAFDLFAEESIDYELRMSKDKFKNLSVYRQQLSKLQTQLQSIQKKYCQQIKECRPVLEIIKNKYCALKIIRIIYQQNMDGTFRYSISAFEFFKVINENKLLMQFTLKGVRVSDFDQFIELFQAAKAHKLIQSQRQDVQWMRSLSPSQSLKLSFNGKIAVSFQNRQKMVSQIQSYKLFTETFLWLSDISIRLYFKQLSEEILSWGNIFDDLCVHLRKIKTSKIEMQFQQSPYTPAQLLPIIRSIFGGITSFTELERLSIYNFKFRNQVNINDLLSIEESLNTIFQNNSITHLNLSNCQNLSPIYNVKPLQSLSMSQVKFRKDLLQDYKIVNQTQQLVQLNCIDFNYKLKINEELFNQMQTLIILGLLFLKLDCSDIKIHEFSLQKPSIIKHFCIENRTMTNFNTLQVLFPKFFNLIFLQFFDVNIGHELICTIPSPYLEEFHLFMNEAITDQGLKAIDQKWPYLANITLSFCTKLSDEIWNICRFKGLIEICTDTLSTKSLTRRGIKVDNNF